MGFSDKAPKPAPPPKRFVLSEHLTQKPFKHSDSLAALKNSLEEEKEK